MGPVGPPAALQVSNPPPPRPTRNMEIDKRKQHYTLSTNWDQIPLARQMSQALAACRANHIYVHYAKTVLCKWVAWRPLFRTLENSERVGKRVWAPSLYPDVASLSLNQNVSFELGMLMHRRKAQKLSMSSDHWGRAESHPWQEFSGIALCIMSCWINS